MKIDDHIIEAAYDLGATKRKVLTDILLPLSIPGISVPSPFLSNLESAAMLITINTIMTRDRPEPRFQLELVVNSCSMIFPIRLIFPPPSMLEITKVVRDGTNTMVTQGRIDQRSAGTFTSAASCADQYTGSNCTGNGLTRIR